MPPLPLVPLLMVLVPLAGGLDLLTSGASRPSFNTRPGGHETELAYCVTATNAYRASVNRSALARDERLEAYAAEAARIDASVGEAHHHLKATNFGNWLVRAENEIPSWPLATYGTVRTVIERGLARMWREGPEGPHYRNMTGDYVALGCGIHVANGEVTVVQAFR
jgi:uncharacterized protein YkwD